LDSHPNVTCIGTASTSFFKYDEALDKLYTKLDAGTTTKNHVFTVRKNGENLKMDKREDRDAEIEYQTLLRCGQSVGDPAKNEYLADSFLSHCDRPDMREIKQVELYMKWRKVVPLRYGYEIWPLPSAEVLNRFKTERTDGAKANASKAAAAAAERASVKYFRISNTNGCITIIRGGGILS
jgi:hypothetical protein